MRNCSKNMQSVERTSKKRKLENIKQSQERESIKRAKQAKEVLVRIDTTALKESLHKYCNKFGPAQKPGPGGQVWSYSVNYDKKESLPNALRAPTFELPVRFTLERVPIADYSVHFPHLWREEKKKAGENLARPEGPAWEALKKEVLKVFSEKLPAARPSFVSYKTGAIIVTFESREARDQAVQATSHGQHHWIVQTKQIPPLLPGFPASSLKRKRVQNNEVHSTNRNLE